MEQMLTAKNIVKVYGEKTVLDNVSMNIQKGDIYGFIGKNGAGKTTFMRVNVFRYELLITLHIQIYFYQLNNRQHFDSLIQ